MDYAQAAADIVFMSMNRTARRTAYGSGVHENNPDTRGMPARHSQTSLRNSCGIKTTVSMFLNYGGLNETGGREAAGRDL